MEDGLDLLSEEEQKRFGSFKSAAAARRFLLGRILLRRVLAKYLHTRPDRLEIGFGAGGKPLLVWPRMAGLDFNLSHDGLEAALAVARGSALGIDLVELDRADAALRISRQFFSAAESSEIEALGEERALGALRLYALKESIVKVDGNTFWQGLSDISLSIVGTRIGWISPPPGGVEADWTLALGYHRERYLLALAQRFAHGEPPSRLEIHSYIVEKDRIEEEDFRPHLMSQNLQ